MSIFDTTHKLNTNPADTKLKSEKSELFNYQLHSGVISTSINGGVLYQSTTHGSDRQRRQSVPIDDSLQSRQGHNQPLIHVTLSFILIILDIIWAQKEHTFIFCLRLQCMIDVSSLSSIIQRNTLKICSCQKAWTIPEIFVFFSFPFHFPIHCFSIANSIINCYNCAATCNLEVVSIANIWLNSKTKFLEGIQ